MPALFTQPLPFALSASVAVGITAIVDTQNAQVEIVVTGVSAYSNMTITRVIADNGHLGTLRNGTNIALNGSSVQVVFDYEAPLDTNIYYTLTLDGDILAISNTVNVATDGITFWLKDVIEGVFSQTVEVGSMSDVTRGANILGTFKVINRANPIVVNDVRSGREGTFTLNIESEAERTALLNLLTTGNTLLLQCPATAVFPDMYFQVGDLVESWNGGLMNNIQRTFTVPFTEVDAPSALAFSLPSNAWLLVAQFEDWQEVLDERATWKDVLLSPFNILLD